MCCNMSTGDNQPTPPLHVVVLMPLKDDWVSAAEVTRRLNRAVFADRCVLDVVLVDDGSIQPFSEAEFQGDSAAVRHIRILHLRRNLGHQRAIAIGLVHIQQTVTCDAVLVMDADGEDTPEGALQLIGAFAAARSRPTGFFFAERTRRTESVVFRAFYGLYKLLHRIFTGVSVRVGNFSIFPAAYLNTLVVMSELWNHYAAAFFRSGLPFTTLPIARGHRLAGQSRMNFVALVGHGMSAISVFGDVVGVRLLLGSMAGSLLAMAGILAVIGIRLFTDQAIPGWATYATGTLTIILIQLVTIALSFTFTMLSGRINLSFVPLRDYAFFIRGESTIRRDD
jgi:polyisoprenyl-phosphate glycosyltransferase